MRTLLRIVLFFALANLLTACDGRTPDDGSLNGTVLVWHTWPAPDDQIIESFLDAFMEINDGVKVASEYVPATELESRFLAQADAGLGPDMIIGPELLFVRDLVDDHLLVDLTPYDMDTSDLLTQALDATHLDEGFYAIPFAAHTEILFYNKTLVETPASTLAELLEHASGGQVVAMPADFHHTFWGVRGFGGDLFDEDGEVLLDDGMVAWMDWMLKAQSEPSVILSDSLDDLYNLFAEGEASYYIGDSLQLPYLRESLGDEVVGVALLPLNTEEEPDDEAATEMPDTFESFSDGSFLELEAIAISKLSSQKLLAKEVAEFFTNPVHQRELAVADLGQIPVNRRVRFDSRMSPSETTLIRQSTSTFVLPLEDIHIEEALEEVVDAIYMEVLEGVLEPEDAVARIHEEFEAKLAGESE